ncbi:MAG: polysaccharide biosynthesis C-terminal domain-containing protein [Pseudoxanthomonas sp.]|nr:polysaccharide biosynthesis C-terminal domain-containing protein [Pseudoxanthomonas sp.]
MSTRGAALRNTLFSSVGIYTEYFLGMLTSIVIARHLGPGDFGAYSLVIWLVAVGVAATNSGAASAVIKYVAELRGAARLDLVRPLLAWLRRAQLAFLAVVMVAGAILFVRYGDRVMPDFDHGVLLAILVATTWLRSSYMFNISVAKGFEDFRATAVVAATVAPLNLALVVAAWWLGGPMEWFLAVFTLSSLAFWWASRRQVQRLLPPPQAQPPALDDDLRARMRSYIALVAVSVTVGFVTASEVEVLFLTLYDSAASAGQFKVAFQLATGAALLVPGVFGALLLPMMANALSQGRELAGRRLSASTSYLALLAAPVVAFGMVMSPAIIGLLYGRPYAPAAPVFAACLLAVSVSTLSQGASSYLLGADRQRSLMNVILAGAVLKVGLDVVLISRYGLAGATVAFALTTIVVALALIVLALSASGARLDLARLGRIVLAGGLAALVAWPLARHLSPLPALLLGGPLVALVYAGATLLLRCWTAADIAWMGQMHQRLAGGRPRALGRLLARAGRHARNVPP